jgi:drug/metabolite transporter (DMT)-like permease|tara:strand:+ start:888 stop:1325 length:438 start_codon:yes stop_codon:yes gene_type:complete
MNDLILATISSFIWSVSTLIDKNYLLKKYKPYEMFLFRSPIFLVLGILTSVLLNNNVQAYNKLTKNEILYNIGSVFFNFIALVIFWYLLTKNDSHYTLGTIQPLYICFVVLLSYLLFNEKMNQIQFFGFALVIIGVMIVNMYKEN